MSGTRRRLGEAERVLELVVEPVVHELDAVPPLDFQILEVYRGNIASGGAAQVVTIREIRHRRSTGASRGGTLCGRAVYST